VPACNEEAVVASKSDFTDEEWRELRWTVMLSGSHITGSDWPGLWKSFKEAAAGSHFLVQMQTSGNQLVSALASDQARQKPDDMTDRNDLAGEPALAHIRAGAALVRSKAPEDFDDFRELCLTVAKVMAEEVGGVSDKETAALDRLRDAFAAEPA
jgi:hypothetical protein